MPACPPDATAMVRGLNRSRPATGKALGIVAIVLVATAALVVARRGRDADERHLTRARSTGWQVTTT